MFGLPWFDLIVAPVRVKTEEGTRDRLLRAAAGLVREQGPEALTVEAVARRAFVGPGALRYHFGGKRGLLRALEERRVFQAPSSPHSLARPSSAPRWGRTTQKR
ncbi:helix-turn-helix transcriptional regulator [Pyxidicoccus parkwayensis]|uniref:Helix-turn-helix transcriptional regulator n=1 Tax=Pyxidicoccus parkwayensis TaxID=2813578 RepID=A0ABX7NMG0_9BACT|nr:helix-turn-helix domain-containing protein [Pyxidicoccus parkwaysis]QSQ19539.1 helix-turn-helix transcriptional regulator [Pyxidicoccus parkwaysis]